MTDPITYNRLTATEAKPRLEEFIDLYLDVYQHADPAFYNETRYRQQITNHMTAPKWEMITATAEPEQLVGYLYGFALGQKTRWWEGLQSELTAEQLTETGNRTVAISEILVAPQWRRQHVATTMHNVFIQDRKEQRATLLVKPDNIPAFTAYKKWGWKPIGKLQPDWPNAPIYQSLIVDLTTTHLDSP